MTSHSAAWIEKCISELAKLDRDASKFSAIWYCKYARDHSFNFKYCDVIGARLRKIYEDGSVAVASSAAIAAMFLAESHNRWKVMGQVLDMAGVSISSHLASRIALDLGVLDDERRCPWASEKLEACAKQIGRDASAFHPVIVRELKMSICVASPP